MITAAATKQARIQDEKSKLHFLMQATAISHQKIRTRDLVTVLRTQTSPRATASITRAVIVAIKAGVISLRSPQCHPCETTRVVAINQVTHKPLLAIKEVMHLKIAKEVTRL